MEIEILPSPPPNVNNKSRRGSGRVGSSRVGGGSERSGAGGWRCSARGRTRRTGSAAHSPASAGGAGGGGSSNVATSRGRSLALIHSGSSGRPDQSAPARFSDIRGFGQWEERFASPRGKVWAGPSGFLRPRGFRPRPLRPPRALAPLRAAIHNPRPHNKGPRTERGGGGKRRHRAAPVGRKAPRGERGAPGGALPPQPTPGAPTREAEPRARVTRGGKGGGGTAQPPHPAPLPAPPGTAVGKGSSRPQRPGPGGAATAAPGGAMSQHGARALCRPRRSRGGAQRPEPPQRRSAPRFHGAGGGVGGTERRGPSRQ